MPPSPEAPGPLSGLRVAILGLGLMGGSLGLALRARRAVRRVVGWNRSGAALGQAAARGAVDEAEADLAAAVREADLVVACVPVEATVPLLRACAPHLAAHAFVTDVGSAKARLVSEAEGILGGRFVGGHPMAGSEESGVGAASAGLYEGAAWLLTPTPATAPAALEAAAHLAAAVGARPRVCGADEHDRLVAAISHLPHLAAYATAAAAAGVPDGWTDIAAGSYRDTTRVAGSDPALWSGILIDNRMAVVERLDDLIAWLGAARDALGSGDAAVLGSLLARAHAARQRFVR